MWRHCFLFLMSSLNIMPIICWPPFYCGSVILNMPGLFLLCVFVCSEISYLKHVYISVIFGALSVSVFGWSSLHPPRNYRGSWLIEGFSLVSIHRHRLQSGLKLIASSPESQRRARINIRVWSWGQQINSMTNSFASLQRI